MKGIVNFLLGEFPDFLSHFYLIFKNFNLNKNSINNQIIEFFFSFENTASVGYLSMPPFHKGFLQSRYQKQNTAEVGKPWSRDQIWSASYFCMPSNRNALHILQLFYSMVCTSLTDFRSPSIYCKYPYTHGLIWGFSFLLY